METTETTTAFRGLESRASGRVHETADPTTVSAEEQARGLDPAYDYDAVDPETLLESPRDGPAGTGRGHWRFDALLPFPADVAISAGEGATPLVPTERLADELDVDAVYVKDEGGTRRAPCSTAASVALTAVAARAAEGQDVEPLACASPGNAGQSMAAYAGRADLRSYAFVPSRCAFSNKAMTNVHGGDMRVVGGRFPDAADAVDEQLETDYTDLGEFVTPRPTESRRSRSSWSPTSTRRPMSSSCRPAPVRSSPGFIRASRSWSASARSTMSRRSSRRRPRAVRRSRPRSNATSTSRSRGRRPTRSAASWRSPTRGRRGRSRGGPRERRYRCGRRGR